LDDSPSPPPTHLLLRRALEEHGDLRSRSPYGARRTTARLALLRTRDDRQSQIDRLGLEECGDLPRLSRHEQPAGRYLFGREQVPRLLDHESIIAEVDAVAARLTDNAEAGRIPDVSWTEKL
jgi:hypothetical protein